MGHVTLYRISTHYIVNASVDSGYISGSINSIALKLLHCMQKFFPPIFVNILCANSNQLP